MHGQLGERGSAGERAGGRSCTFDVVVEKCTIDAMLCAPREGRQMSIGMIDEAHRVRTLAPTHARTHAGAQTIDVASRTHDARDRGPGQVLRAGGCFVSIGFTAVALIDDMLRASRCV
jgi:hypothetical protein